MKTTTKELLLLLTPVLLLFLVGAFTFQQDRLAKAQFRPFITQVDCEHMPRNKEGKRVAEVTLHISHKGERPRWWGKDRNIKPWISEIQYKVPKVNTWNVRVGPQRTFYNKHNKQYTITFQRIGDGSQLFSMYRGMLSSQLIFMTIDERQTMVKFEFAQTLSSVKGQPAA